MKLVMRGQIQRGDCRLQVDTEFEAGVQVLSGPSGAGKTTLLEAIAGLAPFSGTLGPGWEHLPPEARGIGFAFQEDRLFPHLSAQRNLRYGKKSSTVATEKEVIEILGLAPLLSRGVTALSGGEKKRVAVGRAILAAERLLLLDEPLAPLHAELRGALADWLQRQNWPFPVLLVTHLEEGLAALPRWVVEAGSLRKT